MGVWVKENSAPVTSGPTSSGYSIVGCRLQETRVEVSQNYCVVVVVAVFPSRSRLYPSSTSVSTSISVLILSLNTVNSRGHKVTSFK